jgi:hypothetical protein
MDGSHPITVFRLEMNIGSTLQSTMTISLPKKDLTNVR